MRIKNKVFLEENVLRLPGIKLFSPL